MAKELHEGTLLFVQVRKNLQCCSQGQLEDISTENINFERANSTLPLHCHGKTVVAATTNSFLLDMLSVGSGYTLE